MLIKYNSEKGVKSKRLNPSQFAYQSLLGQKLQLFQCKLNSQNLLKFTSIRIKNMVVFSEVVGKKLDFLHR